MPIGGSGLFNPPAAGAAGAKGDTGASFPATSTTSLVTAGSGSRAFTTQSGLAYLAGSRIRATSRGTGEWMEGVVASYASTTLTVTMDLNSGTGTHADWNINVAGQPGAIGATGATGATGAAGSAAVFPDSDPHIAGAGYWVTGVLTKSAG